MTRQNDAIADATLQRHLRCLVEAVRHVGHHQTRNRGTIGGSIAFGEQPLNSPAAAGRAWRNAGTALDARTRTVAAEDFYLGPYATVIEPDELLTAIDVPDWPEDTVTLFREVAMRPGDFALVGLIGSLVLDSGQDHPLWPRLVRYGRNAHQGAPRRSGVARPASAGPRHCRHRRPRDWRDRSL